MIKPLRRYAKYETCLELLETLVTTSQLRFRAEVQVLLSAVLQADEAWAAVTDPDHSFWHDEESKAEELLKDHLDTTGGYDSFLMHVRCIATVLQPLQMQVTELVNSSKKVCASRINTISNGQMDIS